jgi:hypothetical protein
MSQLEGKQPYADPRACASLAILFKLVAARSVSHFRTEIDPAPPDAFGYSEFRVFGITARPIRGRALRGLARCNAVIPLRSINERAGKLLGPPNVV